MDIPVRMRQTRTSGAAWESQMGFKCQTGTTRVARMNDDDPSYEVVPIEPGPHGPAEDWWTVKRNGMPVRYFPSSEKAQRFAADPEYRASLVPAKMWKKTKGKCANWIIPRQGSRTIRRSAMLNFGAACTENLDPNVLTMKSAHYGARIHDAGSPSLARDRRILVQ
jgi:hypothetical protein